MKKYAEYKEAYKGLIKEAISSNMLMRAVESKINSGVPKEDIKKRLSRFLNSSLKNLDFNRRYQENQENFLREIIQKKFMIPDVGNRIKQDSVGNIITSGFKNSGVTKDMAEKNFRDIYSKTYDAAYSKIPELMDTRKKMINDVMNSI